MIINHNEQPRNIRISQGRWQTLAGPWRGRGHCARDSSGWVPPAHPPAGPAAAPVRPAEIPPGVTFSPPGSRGDARGAPERGLSCPSAAGGGSPRSAAQAPRPAFRGSSGPPPHRLERGHSRSMQKSQARQEQLGQESSQRGSAPGVRGRGAAPPTALEQGRGSGGSGGPTPGAAGAAARHGTASPGRASEHAAAALTVQVSAPLAAGEQTC